MDGGRYTHANGELSARDAERVVDEHMETLAAGALFSRDSFENMGDVKEHRIIRKAKRTGSGSAKGDDALINGSVPVHKFQGSAGGAGCRKNKQVKTHSRGRVGEPKKGGAGGKGVWGKPGSELEETSICQDINDPNYDSDSQGEYTLKEVAPLLTEDQVDKAVQPILDEYLDHGKTSEVETLLGELNIGTNKYRIPKLAIMLGLDRHNADREMISRLISDLYNNTLSVDDISRGFDELLKTLDDLVLDTPEAHNLIGQFIARCVADDCLPPKFILSYKGNVNTNKFHRDALEKANVLLSMNHGLAHLDNIWGVGGGSKPVKNLTNKMIALLKEYMSSGDPNEALKCLKELEVPHFHHELVYQACLLAIENSTELVLDHMVELLKFLSAAAVVTIDQFEKGAKRLFVDMPDISLDVPAAHALLEQIGLKLNAAGILSNALLKELPSKGRKRFVSEGDGGMLKLAE